MTRTVIYQCDGCFQRVNKENAVADVEIVFHSDGVFRDKIKIADLCRDCYAKMVSPLKELASRKQRM